MGVGFAEQDRHRSDGEGGSTVRNCEAYYRSLLRSLLYTFLLRLSIGFENIDCWQVSARLLAWTKTEVQPNIFGEIFGLRRK